MVLTSLQTGVPVALSRLRISHGHGWMERQSTESFSVGTGELRTLLFSLQNQSSEPAAAVVVSTEVSGLWPPLQKLLHGGAGGSSVSGFSLFFFFGFLYFYPFWNFTMTGHRLTDHPTARKPDDGWSSVGC